jgi:hypothetical protein
MSGEMESKCHDVLGMEEITAAYSVDVHRWEDFGIQTSSSRRYSASSHKRKQ